MFRDDDWVKVVVVLLTLVVTLMQFYNHGLNSKIDELEKRIDQQQIRIEYQMDVINNINRKVLYPGG